ncbi:MAG: hypothetical protein JWL93_119 [Hyphomicrobiales bacterium]|jgi:multidrug efflux system membrane fusion protein|nr:hypothetical protein [Hyphomicrobiales bacterium]
MRKFFVLILLAAIAGAGAWYYGLIGGQQKPAAQNAAQNAGSRRGGGAIGVIAETVRTADLPIRQRSFGWVEPEQTVVVRSRVASQLLEQHFKEGQMVRKGDLLFTLDDRELAAQVAKDEASLARNRALLTRAESDLKRYQQLVDRNAGTQQALDQATADAKAAAATVQADVATVESDKIRLSYTRIYAPITGRAGAVPIAPGNIVSSSDTGAGLVTITSMDPIRITFTLPERELAALQKALAQPDSVAVRAVEGGKTIATGRLSFIDSFVDQSTGTITAKALFANADQKLWPGRYLDVELDTDMRQNTVVAPAIAIQQGQNGPYVFVAKDDGTAELRNVKLGVSEGQRMEILDGLAAGDRVVIDGQMRLTNGARITLKDEPRVSGNVEQQRTARTEADETRKTR